MRPDPAWTLQPISIHAPARGATEPETIYEWLGIISIHAPARGATVPLSASGGRDKISIHAPARGATRVAQNIAEKAEFQSTLPRGERPEVMAESGGGFNFNPRSREGSDLTSSFVIFRYTAFQSTLPRGERLHLLTFFRLQYGSILFHLTNKYSPCF